MQLFLFVAAWAVNSLHALCLLIGIAHFGNLDVFDLVTVLAASSKSNGVASLSMFLRAPHSPETQRQGCSEVGLASLALFLRGVVRSFGRLTAVFCLFCF